MNRAGVGSTRGIVVGRVCAVAAALVAAAVFPLVAGSQIKETIQVIEFTKRVDESERYTFLKEACTRWTLEAADIVYFFRHAHPISSEEVHARYLHLPCSYTGTLILGGQRTAFGINAGSAGDLGDMQYGCIRECADLFRILGAYEGDDD